MKPETSQAPVQACSRCGVMLDVTGCAIGAWLACPGCGQPVRVRPRPVERPKPPPTPEPESLAWSADPRLVPLEDDRPHPVARAPRTGCLPIGLLAVFSGIVTVMFVGTYLGPQGGAQLGVAWVFGFLNALLVATMTRSILGRDLDRLD